MCEIIFAVDENLDGVGVVVVAPLGDVALDDVLITEANIGVGEGLDILAADDAVAGLDLRAGGAAARQKRKSKDTDENLFEYVYLQRKDVKRKKSWG